MLKKDPDPRPVCPKCKSTKILACGTAVFEVPKLRARLEPPQSRLYSRCKNCGHEFPRDDLLEEMKNSYAQSNLS